MAMRAARFCTFLLLGFFSIVAGVTGILSESDRPATQPQILQFESGELHVLMRVHPEQFITNGELRDGKRLIKNFRGISRMIDYRLIPIAVRTNV